MRRTVTVAAACCSALAAAAAVGADTGARQPGRVTATVGAGVGASPLTLAHAASRGHAYPLGPLYLLNTGTTPARYHLRVERLPSANGRDVPASWVRFHGNDIRLDPNEHAWVKLTVAIPKDAVAGGYATDAVAQAHPVTAPSYPVTVGAAAATSISFSVAGGSGIAARIGWPWPAWLDALLLAGVVLLAALVLRRALGLRLVMDRGEK